MKPPSRAAEPASAEQQKLAALDEPWIGPGKQTLVEGSASSSDQGASAAARAVGTVERAGPWLADRQLEAALGLSSAAATSPAGAAGATPAALAGPPAANQRHASGTADRYFAVHREAFLAALGARLAATSWPAPDPRLAFAAEPATLAPALVRALLEAHDGGFNLASHLPALLHPIDPWQVIDQYRDLEPPSPQGEVRGGMQWRPVIGAALALELEAQLFSSLSRLGPRYHTQLAAGYHQVPLTALVTSHPFDRVTARLLCTPQLVRRAGHGKGKGPRDPFREGLRVVMLEWQGARDPKLWNWVRAILPPDARPEEVALSLYELGDGENHTELAYGITGTAPFFCLPPRWARRFPQAREHAPPEPSASTPEASGALALADSALADEAALAQAGGASSTPMEDSAQVATLPGALERSEHLLALAAEPLVPWELASMIEPALRWVRKHRAAPPGGQARWAPVIERQATLLFTAAGELTEVLGALGHLTPHALTGEAEPARQVLRAYALALGQSHLIGSAEAQLATARALRARLPLRALELSLRESRGAAREAASVAGGAASGADRLAAQDGSEWSALALREAELKGAGTDPDHVEALAVSAGELAHRSRVDALVGHLHQLGELAEDARRGGLASLANAFHGELHALPPRLLRVATAARRTVVQMDQRTHDHLRAHAAAAGSPELAQRATRELLAVRRGSLRVAQAELSALAEREDLERLFSGALQTVQDAQLYRLILEVALLLGVSVIASFAGAAVGGLVRGALLADTAIESAAFYRGAMLARGLGLAANVTVDAGINAIGQTSLAPEEATARAFVVNLLTSAVVIGALSPLQRAAQQWELLQGAAPKLWTRAGGKRVLAQGAVLTAEMVTAAGIGYAVEQLIPRRRRGEEVGQPEAISWILQGAAMGVGRFVAGRLGPLQARLTMAAEHAVHLRSRAAAQAQLASAVESAGDTAAALRLLDEHVALLREESELLSDAPGTGASATAARLGLDPQQLAVLRAGNTTARADTTATSLQVLRLHLAGLEPLSSAGTAWAGTREQIQAALAGAREVQHEAGSGRWTAELAGQVLTFVELAPRALPPGRGQGMPSRRAGEGGAHPGRSTEADPSVGREEQPGAATNAGPNAATNAADAAAALAQRHGVEAEHAELLLRLHQRDPALVESWLQAAAAPGLAGRLLGLFGEAALGHFRPGSGGLLDVHGELHIAAAKLATFGDADLQKLEEVCRNRGPAAAYEYFETTSTNQGKPGARLRFVSRLAARSAHVGQTLLQTLGIGADDPRAKMFEAVDERSAARLWDLANERAFKDAAIRQQAARWALSRLESKADASVRDFVALMQFYDAEVSHQRDLVISEARQEVSRRVQMRQAASGGTLAADAIVSITEDVTRHLLGRPFGIIGDAAKRHALRVVVEQMNSSGDGAVDRSLAADLATHDSGRPTAPARVDSGLSDDKLIVSITSQAHSLDFASSLDAAYHASKHIGELKTQSPGPRRLEHYLRAARQTVAVGKGVVRIGQDGARSIVFEDQGMRAIVGIDHAGTARILTFGSAGPT